MTEIEGDLLEGHLTIPRVVVLFLEVVEFLLLGLINVVQPLSCRKSTTSVEKLTRIVSSSECDD